MSDRIRWKQGRYSNFGGQNWLGYAGTHKPWAFQVWTGAGHEDGWQLIAQLPGVDDRPESADPDELKRTAEEWLERFVSSLGAAFPDDSHPIVSLCECGGLARHIERCRWRTGYGSHVLPPGRNPATTGEASA